MVKRLFPYLGALAVSIAALAVAYGCWVWFSMDSFYAYAKHGERGWIDSPHATDPVLGFRPAPGRSGRWYYPVGPDIAVRISRFGFRIPVDAPDDPPQKRPLVLALGCSFTFGDSCPAEDTYPHRLAQRLGGTEVNAGVCSYGLSHMLVLARRLVPELRPDVVVFQYTPWLVDRSMGFVPVHFGRMPGPYFFRDASGALAAHPAAYSGPALTTDISRFRATPETPGDKLRFFFSVALPLRLVQDLQEARRMFLERLGLLPRPVADRMAIVRSAYREIEALCRQYNARLLVLALDDLDLNEPGYGEEKVLLREMFGKSFVETGPELARIAVERHTPPKPLFALVREGRLVDPHPNAMAHEIYARLLYEALAPGGADFTP